MHYLNLENYNFPAKKIINNLEISNINLDALNMKIDSPDKMKEWKLLNTDKVKYIVTDCEMLNYSFIKATSNGINVFFI